MVNTNAKTPKKNRKSLANAEGNTAISPNAKPGNGNLNTSFKSPGKNKNATPGKKQNFTPGNKQNSTPGNKPAFTPGKKQKPGATPGKNQNQGATPGKKQIKAEVQSPKQAAKTTPNKRPNESNAEGSPPKKLKMFKGTENLDGGAKTQKSAALQAEHKQRKAKGAKIFKILKEKVAVGDKSALANIEEKIKNYESKTDLSKTASRKLKLLKRMKRRLTGEAAPVTTPAQKKNQRKKEARAKAKQTAKQEVAPKQEIEGESDSDEESVDLKLGQIIKTEGASIEDESDDDDDQEEESAEEDASDEEVVSAEEGESAEEEEDSDEEADSDEVPELVKSPAAGRRVNVQYTQGGKKKGAEQKKEVKAKNFKLQAMRKQGQLAGSGKQNQNRAARRNKKNANKVNGA